MATIDFSSVITNEAVTYARAASTQAGWHLTPLKWAISSTQGNLSVERTTESMFTTWIQQPYSGIYAEGTNRLLHHIVIPPDAYASEMTIGEIYFIYTDYYGNDFLYAIAQPTTNLSFTPGVSQSYIFAFTLNNTNVADTILIDYTYPQDIEDHNRKLDAHDYLLARDGSRTATNILSYSTKLDFTSPRQIVDKEYIDNITNIIQDKIDTIYCPPGTMMWWPNSTAPAGWLPRHGQSLNTETYKNLFNVLGYTYGGSGTSFNVPDDRGLFLRGHLSGTTANFGQKQNSGLPNIKGTGMLWYTGGSSDEIKSGEKLSGAIYKDSSYGEKCRDVNDNATSNNAWCLSFDANKSNSIYMDNVNEVRPTNRNYLPIIKY